MRVYDKGKYVPIEEVTWDLLCKASTYVDFNQDVYVDWPEHIRVSKWKALRETLNHLGIEEKINVKAS